jgi:GT2 family glycosyltransferase
MKTNAIIVNYFTAAYLNELIEVLQNEEEICSIIIVDNGDKIDLNSFTIKYPKTTILKNARNIGFAAAVNIACKSENADYYLLINPDTLPEPGFAKALLKVALDTDALITGPRFYWDKEKTFRLPPALGYSWTIRAGFRVAAQSGAEEALLINNWIFHHERFWEKTEPFSETFLSGGCMLIKNDTGFFENGKILDERFFLYYEDTDLCLRAIANNKLLMVAPKASIVHFWDRSPSENKNAWMADSEKLFLEKYFGKQIELQQFTKQVVGLKMNIIDLGVFATPPVFQLQFDNSEEKYYIEFALIHLFIPFAQAVSSDKKFYFPKCIWDGLKPGIYYTRQRTTTNRILKIWKWKKL